MRKIFRKHEELSFTLAVYGLLVLVLASFLAVRLSKEGHAKRRAGPRILSLEPGALVLGASERVSVMSDRTHFGAQTTVESSLAGVYFTNIRFASEREMTFEAHVLERADLEEGAKILFTIRSPVDGEEDERIPLELSLTRSAEPLELDLSNFGGKSRVEVEGDHIMFGYRPKGHGPYRFTARSFETGKTFEQETRAEVDHLGVALEPGENTFELVLEDALGREARKIVTVQRKADLLPPGVLANAARGLWSTYTGKPTQWSSDPGEQVAASDCVLGNGPLGCGTGGCGSGGCGSGSIRPPPNDYVTSLGQVEIGGEGVLLHNGQYREDVVDLYIPGRGLDFVFKRSYQSGLSLDGYLGTNWDFSWGAHFTLTGSLPCDGKFSRGDGRRDVYSGCQLQGSEYVFTTKPTGYVDLKTSVVPSASEIRQTKRNGFWQAFDQTTGKLKARTDRYGNKLSVYYDINGKISLVKDTLNRDIYFYYGGSGDANAGRLTAVTDFASRTVNYEYKEAWTNGPVVLTKVKYPAANWIDDTTDPWTTKTGVSRTTEYKYDSTYARLTEVLDGRGKERVKMEYDPDKGYRVTKQYNYSSTSSHGFAWTLEYDKVKEVVWTNRSGNERKITFDTSKHLSTKREVRYTPDGGSLTWVATNITRDCACTLPTAIQEPDNGYTTFTIDSAGNVTEKREYYDNTPGDGYFGSPFLDLRRKAYFEPVTATFGVCTKVVSPKAFIQLIADEDAHATFIYYDGNGNPITIWGPDTTNPTQTDHIESRSYNSYGQLLTVSRPEGMLTTYTYYDGVETPTSNKAYLKQVKIKYKTATPNELITTYKYSNYGARTSVKDPLNRETVYVVDNEFLVKQVTTPSPFSYVKKLSYNGERQLVKEELENRKGTGSADGSNPWWETEYKYGIAGELSTKKSEISYSNPTTTWREQSFAYDAEYRRILATVHETGGYARQTSFTLDERGLVTKVIRAYASPSSPNESEERFAYDEEGKLSKTTRPFRNPGDGSDSYVITRVSFDHFDRKEYIYDGPSDSNPDNYTRFYYDHASMVTTKDEFDSSSNHLRRTKHVYDELNRLQQAIRGTNGEDTTTCEYDKANRRTKISDDNSNARTMEYDLAGRVTKTLTPNLGAAGQNYVTVEHDLNGNVVKQTSHEVETLSPYASADFVWEMAYDELNRRTTMTSKGSDGATGPNPVETVNTYDTRNLLIKSTDVDGVPTEHEYDGLRRRTKTTINIGGAGGEPVIVLQATYDRAGNLLSRTDDEGNVTTYAYDDQSRRTKETLDDGDWIKWEFNDLSLPITKAWGHDTEGGRQTLTYRYDHRGLLTTKVVSWTTGAEPSYTDYANYKTTEETFGYDGVGRLTSANDDDAKVTFVWNSLDQVTQEKLNINLRTGCPINYPTSCVDNWKLDKTTTSAWDSTGKRRTSVTYPITGKVFNYTYDALDRVTQLSHTWSTKGLHAEYNYEGSGLDVIRRDRWLDLDAGTNTFRTSSTDDALKRLTEIKHERITGSAVTLSEVDYTWGNGSSGKIWQRSSYDISGATTVNHDYLYDKIGRLSKDTWEHTTPDEEYTFTLTDTQFLSKIEKKPLGGSTTTVRQFTKATDGSLQMTDYSDPTTTCSFDVAGNMTAQGTTTTYHYDHENRLIHIDGATDFWFRYDALGRRVVEKEGSTERLFYYDGLHIIEETDSSLGLNRLSLFGIQLDELLYSGDTDGSGILTDHHWPLTDHLGSVIRVLDNSAGLLANFDYTSAYGQATVTGTDSTYPYGFTGRRRILAALPLYDYRTRVYDPGCGRFVQRDSIGIWGDAIERGNGYAYAGNDPQQGSDPLGRWVVAAAAGATLGIVIIVKFTDWNTDYLTDEESQQVTDLLDDMKRCAAEVGDHEILENLDGMTIDGKFEEGYPTGQDSLGQPLEPGWTTLTIDGSSAFFGRPFLWGNRTVLAHHFFDYDKCQQYDTLLHESYHATEDWNDIGCARANGYAERKGTKLACCLGCCDFYDPTMGPTDCCPDNPTPLNSAEMVPPEPRVVDKEPDTMAPR